MTSDIFGRVPPQAFILALPLTWVVCCLLIGRIGGWSRLAESYRHTGVFEGKRWSMRSARLRWGVPYGNVVTFGANGDGLHMAVLALWRPGHPPLFVPWRDVSVTEARGWLRRYIELRFRRCPEVPVRLHENLAATLALESRGAWTGPRVGAARPEPA